MTVAVDPTSVATNPAPLAPTTKFSDLNAYLQGVQNRVGTLLQTNALAVTAAALGSNLLPTKEVKPFSELYAIPVYLAAGLLAYSTYRAVDAAGLTVSFRQKLLQRLMKKAHPGDPDYVDQTLRNAMLYEFHTKHRALRYGRIALNFALLALGLYAFTIWVPYLFWGYISKLLSNDDFKSVVHSIFVVETAFVLFFSLSHAWTAKRELQNDLLVINGNSDPGLVIPAEKHRFPIGAGIFFGLGLGGFFDGIILHQILQWHHMVTSAGYPANSVEGLEYNTLWDGVFHIATYICVLIGLVLLWRTAHYTHLWWSGKLMCGTILIGFGIFNLIEGLIDHQILGLHHVNETVPHEEWIYWDIGFLAWGAVMLIGGWLLYNAGKRQPE